MSNKFITISIIQDAGINNSNRDDVGEVKSVTVGGCRRQRRSSQCKKRVDRKAMIDLGISPAYRSKILADKLYKEALAKGVSPKEALSRIGIIFGTNKTPGKLIDGFKDLEKSGVKGTITTSCLIYYSEDEYQQLLEVLLNGAEITTDIQGILTQGQKRFGGLVALFGRMMADHPDMNVEAAAAYSHAFSTHEIAMESDYFTAMDDCATGPGAGHLDQTSFTHSVLFQTVVLDIEQLKCNLPDTSPEDIQALVCAFIEAVITSAPEGKKNAFYSNTLPEMVVIDKTSMPISMCGAFETPVQAAPSGGYSKASVEAFKAHREDMLSKGYPVEESYGLQGYSIEGAKAFIKSIL
jgi:CRISPR system Cascade subunit CasC